VFSISRRAKAGFNLNFFSRLAEIDRTACEVEFATGILGRTISLTDAGTWVVSYSDNAPDDDITTSSSRPLCVMLWDGRSFELKGLSC
jgi:hypothetical protein